MDLKGWDYTGRNIGPELHKQFKIMVDCLSDSSFVHGLPWGTDLQEKLAKRMGMSSSGAVRTVKKMCDNFGFFISDSLTSKEDHIPKDFLSQRGKIIYQTATLELEVMAKTDMDSNIKKRVLEKIKVLYEEAYCDALLYYHFDNPDGTYFYPLKATIKALLKYKQLDKWEWYLLNTFVRHNDNEAEELALEKAISKYRAGAYSFSMTNVIEKPKGHQYTPQYFEYAGLLYLSQRPEWFVYNSKTHAEIKEKALSMDYKNI